MPYELQRSYPTTPKALRLRGVFLPDTAADWKSRLGYRLGLSRRLRDCADDVAPP